MAEMDLSDRTRLIFDWSGYFLLFLSSVLAADAKILILGAGTHLGSQSFYWAKLRKIVCEMGVDERTMAEKSLVVYGGKSIS